MKKTITKWVSCPEFWLILITIIGSLSRLMFLGRDPLGLHQDEAYSTYNAWAVMNYGIDSFGNTRPVYYTAWGSGMSVLYSYLTMPFIALFGIHFWTIRLPQAIMGSLCIPAMYGFGRELFQSKWKALACSAILAINPWHIQQSRVAFDCNLGVPTLLFAMYFTARYLNGKYKSIWGAALFYGLTLYCYALTWILIPLLLILICLFYHKRIRFDRHLAGAMILLFVMALPLLLYVAVNMGWIGEIQTGFFSIPRMNSMRTNEMEYSAGALKRRLIALLYTLWIQHDDRWWISNAQVGSYYYVSTPFILLGLVYYLVSLVKLVIQKCKRGAHKAGEFPIQMLLAIWFGAGFLLGCSVDTPYYHRINYLHIPIILMGLEGICILTRLCRRKRPAYFLPVAIYAVCFGMFLYGHITYPVDYSRYGNNYESHMNWTGYEKALDYAKTVTDGTIYIQQLNYVPVMLYEQIPPQEFVDTVSFKGDPQFMLVHGFGRYAFDELPEADEDAAIVYIYPMEQELLDLGYQTVKADHCYGVAWKPENVRK